ncbi:MAG TPA: hypothetical protein VGA52_00050 [Anaerolineales bacterium]|jgi:hypothetical protein
MTERKTTMGTIVAWPIVALWRLLSWILSLTGRLVAAVLGLVLMIAGFVLTVTVLAAPVGVPLMVVGILLVFRALF